MRKTASFVASSVLASAASWPAGAETRPTFPLPQGDYSDGHTCGAAEIRRNRLLNAFNVADVMGGICQLKSVTPSGNVYEFHARCEEGNGAADHTWTVESQITVTGDDAFVFDKTTYRFCSTDQGAGGATTPHADTHLPLVPGSYRTAGGACGALEYLDNPHAPELGGMFGGPAYGGDLCRIKRVVSASARTSFETTCTPTRSGARMRISVPETIQARSPQQFAFKGKQYDLCHRMIY